MKNTKLKSVPNMQGGAAPKGLIASTIHNIVTSFKGLNDSKFFMGAVMIMMNIASKHINIELTPSQQKYFKNNMARQLLIFAIAWTATKDIFIALAITAIFHVLAMHLLNEDSSYCIIPRSWRNFEKILDTNNDGEVSDEEIKKAKEVLEKARLKEIKREALRNMNDFKMSLY
tara:strand:+ start:383 stop:901 length:519 start_codon:yes stop_codon:yes gene_type:complete